MKLLWALILFGLPNQYVISEVSTGDNSPSPSNANSSASLPTVTAKSLSSVLSQTATAAVENTSTSVSGTIAAATTVSDSSTTQRDKVKSMTDSHLTTETVQTTGGRPATTLISTSAPNVFTPSQQAITSGTTPNIVSTISQVDHRGSTPQPPTSALLTASSVLSRTEVSTTNNHLSVTTANDSLPHIQPTTAEKEEELDCMNLETNLEATVKIISCTTEKKTKVILKVRHKDWGKFQKDFQGSKDIPTSAILSPSTSPSTSPSPPPSPSPSPSSNTYLVTILASSSALLAIIIGIITWTICHQRCNRKNQQHLTEELHTTENGYHDNPTLEVMEVQPEMQEKKMVLNGEFNDSWIVPFDNLVKDDLPDEEDTHL